MTLVWILLSGLAGAVVYGHFVWPLVWRWRSGPLYGPRMALLREGKQAALDLYSDVLSKQPNNVDALVERGVLAIRLGRFDDARADLEKALALRPEFRRAKTVLMNMSHGGQFGGPPGTL